MVSTLVNLVGVLMIHHSQTQNVRCKVVMMLSFASHPSWTCAKWCLVPISVLATIQLWMCFTSRNKELPLSSIDYLTWACFKLKKCFFPPKFTSQVPHANRKFQRIPDFTKTSTWASLKVSTESTFANNQNPPKSHKVAPPLPGINGILWLHF